MIYHEATQSLCSICHKKISAKIMLDEKKVFLQKHCPEHGFHQELLEEDKDYYLRRRKFDKCGTKPKPETEIKNGCPFDCGLCPNHDQHSCIGLIEVTNNCDLGCRVCYAKSGDGDFMSLEKFEEMLDFLVEAEGGQAEILQISGGEPTTHPQILEIIRIAKTKKIKYLMLNTNGLRIAEDEAFVKALAEFNDAFEIYLQFDGFKAETHTFFRGRNLADVKQKAIENLRKYNLPITLVTTVQKGVNEDELCEIVEYGTNTVGVRGVNFQPVAHFGRLPKNSLEERSTLSGIVDRLETNLPYLEKGDILPLPCNVERNAVTYLVKKKPITRGLDPTVVAEKIKNTFALHIKEALPDKVCCVFDLRKYFVEGFCKLPRDLQRKFIDKNVFRISVTSFIDFYNFDLKSMQKECVHIVTEDLKRIPFSSYNMFYRKIK